LALKLNGLLPLQLGASGCSIFPEFMAHHCILVYKKLYKEIKNDPYYQYIALVNDLQPKVLNIKSLKSMVDFWNGYGKKIVFFTAPPRFKYYRESLGKNVQPTLDLHIADLSTRKELMDFLKSQGVYIIDTAKIFCGITNNCGYQTKGGQFLLIDETHMSPLGDREFGRILLEKDELFKQWR